MTEWYQYLKARQPSSLLVRKTDGRQMFDAAVRMAVWYGTLVWYNSIFAKKYGMLVWYVFF